MSRWRCGRIGAIRTVAGVAEVVSEEVKFPSQRYGEVFAETLLGGGVAGWRGRCFVR